MVVDATSAAWPPDSLGEAVDAIKYIYHASRALLANQAPIISVSDVKRPERSQSHVSNVHPSATSANIARI